MQEKQRLKNIDFIRPIAVLLIVLWHTFIIYQGGWHEPENFGDVKVYWWIAKFAIIFSLELFTFVSGYVFSFQNSNKPKPFGMFVKGKAKRLLIPGIIFSLLYVFLISGIHRIQSIPQLCVDVICGVGHLWYLPMLFVVFVLSFFIIKLNVKIVNLLMVVLLTIATVILAIQLPFNISLILYYLPFFLMGYYFYQYREKIAEKLQEGGVLLVFVVFLISFLSTTIAKDLVDSGFWDCGRYDSVVRLGIKVIHLIAAFFGVVFVYGLSNLYVKKHNGVIPKALDFLNPYCFGIYLFQQFILQTLYFKTPLFATVGTYLAPWIAFIITIITSFILTYLLRLSKAGRFLIG